MLARFGSSIFLSGDILCGWNTCREPTSISPGLLRPDAFTVCGEGAGAMKNRSMDLLKFQSFPDLAAAVRARKDSIMERWLHQVRTTLPAAHEMTLAQVRDDLPETLELL